ncbi:hypothetical protein LSAT2_002639 [Lamellibrachia satsuma]|nr:hypothetical protein LSAT2_002639 [Lamellibrachia satsuma]
MDLPCTDLPCTDLQCTDLPCNDLPFTDLPCTDLPCTNLPCTDLPCGILDKADFKSETLKGNEAVDKLTSKLSRKFKTTFEAVSTIKNYLERNYGSFQHKPDFFVYNCCDYPTNNLEYNHQAKNKVNPNDLCYTVSKDAKHNVTIPASKALLRIFKENLNNGHSIQAQYFGSEEGVIVGFPANNKGSMCSHPGTYDARYRPWYVEAATPIPKDIVVVLDSSGTMSHGQSMKMAKDAAKTVVTTLNPKDRIGVVVFSDEAYTPPGSDETSSCFGRQLAYATSDNTDYLLDYLERIKAFGGTNYMSALEKAFDLLRHSPAASVDTRKRRKAIIFLTDGKPVWASAERILQLIADQNAQLDNEVMILTYAFGEEIDLDAQALLRNMSRQTMSNRTMGDVTPGDFKLIDSVDHLRLSLGSYYNFFSGFDLLKIPIVTSPYVSNYNVGLVLSVCLPVHQDELQGVAAVDISLADLLEDVAYFRHGENSYAFVIDGTGRTFMHPYVPSFFQTSKKRPIFYDISAFEPHVEAKSVIASMKRGDSGNKRFSTKLVRSRGDPRRDGFYMKTVVANYFWRPVVGTNFSVCIVFTDTDRELTPSGKFSSRHFVYHRLDLRRPTEMCRLRGSISTLMHSVVKFTGTAFRNAYKYYNTEEDDDSVRRYENYMKGEDTRSTVFRKGVRQMVAVTENIDKFWKATNSPSILLRYVGFSNGVVRQFPADIFPTLYDHTTRPWYQSALAQRGSLVLTTPYKTSSFGDLVVTLSRVLYQGSFNGQHSKKDMVIGVMGLDIKVEFLEKLLNNIMPDCSQTQTSCFIVDTSGYLVYHEDVTHEHNDDIEYIHLIQKEPDIAIDLIKRGLMKKERCTSLTTKNFYYTWKLESGGVDSKWPKYRLQFVRDTNIYVGIKSVSRPMYEPCVSCTAKRGKRATYQQCERWDDGHVCQCPCYAKAGYEYCNNKFPNISSSNPACPPEPPVVSYTRPITSTALVAGLPECYKLNCEERDESDCGLVFGCSWCSRRTTETARCYPENRCIAKVKSDPATGSWSSVEYVGAATVCLAVIVVLICTTIYVGKYRHIDFIAMSGECVTKVQNRSARRLPPPTDSDHVYETIRQLQLDMAAREQMRDRSNTGDSDYLRPATVSIHPAGGEAETAFNSRTTVSTITVNADEDARSSPIEQRLQRGGSEGSLAHTPSDDFVWM